MIDYNWRESEEYFALIRSKKYKEWQRDQDEKLRWLYWLNKGSPTRWHYNERYGNYGNLSISNGGEVAGPEREEIFGMLLKKG